MLSEIEIKNVLFLDIETVPQVKSYRDLSRDMQALWDKKSAVFRSEEQSPEDAYERAGIYAEFGRIICISVGIVTGSGKETGLRLKSYADQEEKVLLASFRDMLESYSGKRDIYLCAHNGKEFDFPYLARRMLLNGVKLPSVLDSAGKKPWEIRHLDTMELWKFGDYKHYTSLELLTRIFDIPSPKDDMDGSMVASVYYEENNLSRIIEYCQHDVVAVAQLLMRYRGESLIPEERIQDAP
jgi:3'-5' exonuclease